MKRLYFIFILASTLLFSNAIFAQKLNNEEEKGILLMREEEKLAYDVYQALYKSWELPIFNNISNSEARHIDAVGNLIDQFGLKDPVINKAGKFQNTELSELYKTLTEKGSKSLIDALEVGALIEEVDIEDLQNLIDQTSNETIKMIYGNLLSASENHLRAFTGQLESRGEIYTPTILDDVAFQQLVKAPHQRGSDGANCIIQENKRVGGQNNVSGQNRYRGNRQMRGQSRWN